MSRTARAPRSTSASNSTPCAVASPPRLLSLCELSSFALFQSLTHIINNHLARLLRGHLGIIDHARAEGDHQRRRGALAVALVASRQVFIHALGGAAPRAFMNTSIKIEFEIGL